MLKERVITAIVLLMVIVALAALSTPGAWMMVSIMLTTAIAYEYGQLIGFRRITLILYIVSTAVILTIFLLHFKFFPTTWPRSVVDWGAGSVLLIYWALLVPYILKNRLQIY